jgi:hypothetical protein
VLHVDVRLLQCQFNAPTKPPGHPAEQVATIDRTLLFRVDPQEAICTKTGSSEAVIQPNAVHAIEPLVHQQFGRELASWIASIRRAVQLQPT